MSDPRPHSATPLRTDETQPGTKSRQNKPYEKVKVGTTPVSTPVTVGRSGFLPPSRTATPSLSSPLMRGGYDPHAFACSGMPLPASATHVGGDSFGTRLARPCSPGDQLAFSGVYYPTMFPSVRVGASVDTRLARMPQRQTSADPTKSTAATPNCWGPRTAARSQGADLMNSTSSVLPVASPVEPVERRLYTMEPTTPMEPTKAGCRADESLDVQSGSDDEDESATHEWHKRAEEEIRRRPMSPPRDMTKLQAAYAHLRTLPSCAFEIPACPLTNDAEKCERNQLRSRRRQIALGKMQPEYQRYAKCVPKEDREAGNPHHPVTPRASYGHKRPFQRTLHSWRCVLHDWARLNPNEVTLRGRITTDVTTVDGPWVSKCVYDPALYYGPEAPRLTWAQAIPPSTAGEWNPEDAEPLGTAAGVDAASEVDAQCHTPRGQMAPKVSIQHTFRPTPVKATPTSKGSMAARPNLD